MAAGDKVAAEVPPLRPTEEVHDTVDDEKLVGAVFNESAELGPLNYSQLTE
jgi:hypothetical protein